MIHGLRLYAHRGASIKHAENSLEAFDQALRDGANALELDVHRTADGHFVVAHDPDGSRLMGDPRSICDLTLAEVERWRHRDSGAQVSTLDEVLDRYAGVPMSIDFKPDVPALVPAFVEGLTRSGAEHSVTIASFHHRILQRVRAAGWQGRMALSRLEVAALRLTPIAVARRFVRGHSAQVPTTAGPLRLDRKVFLERCRRLGLRVDFWVVNDPTEALDLLRQGATGLMTDDPESIAPVVRAFETERLGGEGMAPANGTAR